MKRDGANKSLWQDKLPDYKPGNFEVKDIIYDVVIVGGGVTGITTAYELQKRGLQCLIAEAHSLCFGTSGGTTAHLNTFFDKTYAEVVSDFGKKESELLATAARDAIELYKNNIGYLMIDCEFSEHDGFVFAQNEKQQDELEKMYSSSLEAGVEVKFAGKIPVNIPFVKALSFPGQAQIHPVKYVYGLASAFEEKGGRILENCFITAVDQGEINTLHYNGRALQAKHVVYATHTPPGVNLLHMRCAPYRSYVMAIELEDGNYPDGPAYDMEDPYHYYRTQETNGKKYLIAGGEDHKTGHEENTEQPFDKLENYLRGVFKIKEIKFKWSSQYFEPVDGLPYIGQLPGAGENILVATGFGGNGMIYSHVAAKVLTEIITKSPDAYDGLFKPSRIKPFAGFSSFVKENADVAATLIKGVFSSDHLRDLEKMADDSGRVVKMDHESMALYKDDSGSVFALHPVCTHLKCVVTWNQTEKSWDCPCHGARYATDGTVLTGPSTRHLNKIEIPVPQS
jgi:glycine/D-amino acid oxidase-like deaminating enzyme/nitrite reductase/ring-hydroxylating ferredoxin subunit